MDKINSIRKAVCCLLLTSLIARNHGATFNIQTKGAKGDGVTDDGPAIVAAWKEACAAASPPNSVLIPPGTYFTLAFTLSGPCQGPVEIKAAGAILKAPPELEKFKDDSWITIEKVRNLTLNGGTFDGQGHGTWTTKKCHDSEMKCAIPVNLRLSHVRDSLFKDFTSANSKNFHITLWKCDHSKFNNITISAPANSTNTDGIHIAKLDGLNITNTIIKTGDDCISFGDGSKNVYIEKVTCGPGHGISIGSLGKFPNEEPVQGVYIRNCTISGTTNGLRIKTWPGSQPGIASDMHFHEIIMDKVANPILIDQEYCPHNACKKGPPSKVKLSNVSFRKITGTSTTKEALKFVCSAGAPCENVTVADINLTFKGPGGGGATFHCSNVNPKVIGQNFPPACPAAAATAPQPTTY
ncbi:exopolygalacturonase-like [Rutidosis leptorrhynchoides]|uniref:exopolygalacturonase-like n=1 Tax=Rutidosis leptorrhynchoides TaxID=125765 RepID=UPI003A9988E8